MVQGNAIHYDDWFYYQSTAHYEWPVCILLILQQNDKRQNSKTGSFPRELLQIPVCFRECIMADKPLSTQYQGNKHNDGFM